MKNITSIIILLCLAFQGFTQDLTGVVVNQDKERLTGATVQWAGTTVGVATNVEGYFKIPRLEETNMLVISYVGYTADTIEITPEDEDIIIFFAMGVEMETVEITAKERDNFISTLKTYNIETINSGELRKAACCNLSESFETNGSVNVAYSDAVTGAKEIEMLGLRGIYTQMQTENRPSMRGLAYPFGMEYIPGTWVSNISIAKGASTVVNGYEGMAGNINVELIKPFNGEKLFVNTYVNHVGRGELNVHLNHQISHNWSVGLLLHGNYFNGEVDHNEDTFLDIPKKENLNGLFRLFYRGENLRGQFNVQALTSRFAGGQIGYDENPTELYGVDLLTERVEVFGKIGYLGFENQFASLGWIANLTYHKNDGFFGRNSYDATQRSFYTNLIYQNIIGTSDHNYKLGASFVYDKYDEMFADVDYSLVESVPGAFFEYNYQRDKKVKKGEKEVEKSFGLVLGLRTDYHNIHGLFITPRMNIKYNFDENTVVRINAGRGYRTARILAENISALTSSRMINLTEDLKAEEAWNFGVNFTKNFEINTREFSVSTDLYSTHFVNQIVMDRESVAEEIQFYNLDGQSYSNSFLTSVTAEIFDFLEMKLAYKFNDVKVTYGGELMQMPLIAKHRGLISLGFNSLDETWKLHTTVQIVGPQRMPTLLGHENHSAEGHESLTVYHLTGVTPTYATLNAQLTKTFGKWEVYIGGENLTNYTQHDPIIGASDPFNEDLGIPVFDASQIYAPIMGTMIYAGFRFTIK
jgi:hypothetical protein